MGDRKATIRERKEKREKRHREGGKGR